MLVKLVGLGLTTTLGKVLRWLGGVGGMDSATSQQQYHPGLVGYVHLREEP